MEASNGQVLVRRGRSSRDEHPRSPWKRQLLLCFFVLASVGGCLDFDDDDDEGSGCSSSPNGEKGLLTFEFLSMPDDTLAASSGRVLAVGARERVRLIEDLGMGEVALKAGETVLASDDNAIASFEFESDEVAAVTIRGEGEATLQVYKNTSYEPYDELTIKAERPKAFVALVAPASLPFAYGHLDDALSEGGVVLPPGADFQLAVGLVGNSAKLLSGAVPVSARSLDESIATVEAVQMSYREEYFVAFFRVSAVSEGEAVLEFKAAELPIGFFPVEVQAAPRIDSLALYYYNPEKSSLVLEDSAPVPFSVSLQYAIPVAFDDRNYRIMGLRYSYDATGGALGMEPAFDRSYLQFVTQTYSTVLLTATTDEGYSAVLELRVGEYE